MVTDFALNGARLLINGDEPEALNGANHSFIHFFLFAMSIILYNFI